MLNSMVHLVAGWCGEWRASREIHFMDRMCSLAHSRAARSFSLALAAWLAAGGASTIPLRATSSAGAKDEGAVSVTSDPSDAAVFMDGAFVGRTPVMIPRLSAGDHRLRVVRDGYLEHARLVVVSSGKTGMLHVRLSARDQTGTAIGSGQPVFRVVVLEGENSVNIIDKQTAVQPVVEVLDQNNLPVAGASVLFVIGGRSARFVNGAPQVTVTTDAAGRAATTALNPLRSGSFQIQVRATFQGQTAATTIHQVNFATLNAAVRAGQATGQAAQGGSVAGTSGAAGAAIGSGGGLSALAIAGIVAGAAGGTLVAVRAASARGMSTPGMTGSSGPGITVTAGTWSYTLSDVLASLEVQGMGCPAPTSSGTTVVNDSGDFSIPFSGTCGSCTASGTITGTFVPTGLGLGLAGSVMASLSGSCAIVGTKPPLVGFVVPTQPMSGVCQTSSQTIINCDASMPNTQQSPGFSVAYVLTPP